MVEKIKQKLGQMAGMEKKNGDLKTFIFNKDEVLQTKVFSSCLLKKDVFAFGILLPRNEDILDKKSLNVLGQRQVWRPVLITSNRRGLVISEWFKKEYKVQFSNIPYDMSLRWELKDVETYLRKVPIEVKPKELFEEIKKEYEYYCYFREKEWYSFRPLWDIGTYVHQLFSNYAIIENRGLSGTGKTKSMQVSSYITLNGTEILTNPSEATLFRETENTRPTKYIDEAEKLFKWGKDGMEADNRVELINASYSRNGVVPRQEKYGNQYITKKFHVYSPTMVSSINGLYGATENRAITQIHTKAPDNDARGEREPEDDANEPKWKEIRNKCYLFALQNWKKIQEIYINFNIPTNLKKRDLQLWKPILTIASIIDEDLLKEMIEFAEKISSLRKIDTLSEGSMDYKLLDCMHFLIKNNTSDRIYVEAIRQRYDAIFNTGKEKKTANKTISTHLDKLGFKGCRNKDMQGSYYELTLSIFNEVVSPLTSDFSSEPSYPSDSNVNNSNSNDNYMMNNDEL